uniref:Dirigent protein n=1 Tax=Kalanchoe fedtschenkoi TaxID=63787 RepID=A0A7N0R9U2_KALFE
MGFKLPLLLLLLCIISLSLTSSAAYRSKKGKVYKPCKELVLFFHDVIYNGKNAHNATATIIGGAAGSNRTILTSPYHFGNIVAFDDPITLDNNFHGKPVGRAQGLYLYDKLDTFGAWLGFSFLLNSTQHKGTINFIGADPLMEKTRDISVVGGTGDFFMARGVATVSTDSFEGDVYFRLRVDIKLYECW